MNNFNGGSSTPNSKLQSSIRENRIKARYKKAVNDYKISKRASEYNDEMIRQLKMELENIERQVEEEEKAYAATQKETKNEMVLDETYEKYVELNDELDAEILEAYKEDENHMAKLISEEEQLSEEIGKASGIDRASIRLRLENKDLEILVATGEALIGEILSLRLEHEKKMARDGDCSNLPTVVKSGGEQGLDEMKVSDDEASVPSLERK